ncbi:MAG: hypothetical protein ABI587_02775 [Gemmatimonadales bacterium]
MRRLAVVFGVALGAGIGWTLAHDHIERHRENLFSPRPFRRLAALGGIDAAGELESVRVLHDYLQWERHPVLRRRARAIVRRLEAALGYTPPGT